MVVQTWGWTIAYASNHFRSHFCMLLLVTLGQNVISSRIKLHTIVPVRSMSLDILTLFKFDHTRGLGSILTVGHSCGGRDLGHQ